MYAAVFGIRLFGKVDRVPGWFYVATEFGHCMFIPMIPVATYVVLAGSERGSYVVGEYGFRGVKIRLSFKSVMMAWLRFALLVAAFAVPMIGILVVADMPNPIGDPTARFIGKVTLCFPIIAFVALGATYLFNRASLSRGAWLAEQAGIDPLAVSQRLKPGPKANIDVPLIETYYVHPGQMVDVSKLPEALPENDESDDRQP